MAVRNAFFRAHTRRGAAIIAAALAASASLTGCSGGASGSNDEIAVALITKTNTNPYFVKMRDGAEQAAKTAGVRLMTAAGAYDGDNAGQVTAVQNMVAAGVKGIMITPNDPKAIAPTLDKARQQGVVVIALDTPPNPRSSVDALYATDNVDAGKLIGAYAKAAEGGKPVKIAMLDLSPGVTVGVDRHTGFLQGFGLPEGDPRIVCAQDTSGDQTKGQTAMENCLQKDPGINLVYAINEPAALGAFTALKAVGKDASTMIVAIDGGCTGVKAVQSGQIAATSQQYPLKMAAQGLDAVVTFAKTGKKPSGYTDTGVNLITAHAQPGVASKDIQFGLDNCWG
ncbi:substrate-binding domain-containing protein [Amycolatopsis pigmentata]|uniref:Substrate-binding domain-containing protein n=1 Tax=Amycolatopsis pigmentata TaxID=450801 RepID=A0ABW5G1I4_9PSEU